MSVPVPPLVQKARAFATEAHQRINHRRKYNLQPYDVHLKAVADLVATVSTDPEMLAAAWLHDIVEDTPVTLDDLLREFGTALADLVRELTDVSRPRDGNRAVRKAIDRAHLARASARAQTIKLADLCDNAEDISAADPKFARVYLQEMAALLQVLGAGDARLMDRAQRILGQCQARIRPSAPAAPADPMSDDQLAQVRALRRQMNTFSVRDLASPLASVDDSEPAARARRLMEARGWPVIGVRRDGRMRGYLRAGEGGDGPCADVAHPIRPDQVLESTDSLSGMVHVLTRYDFAFVQAFGQVAGVLTRDDLHQPIGRMWLFGMITLIEMEVSARIRDAYPGDNWQPLVTEGRLEKARQLQEERARRGFPAALRDCLQLSDKISILTRSPELLQAWGYANRRAAQAGLRELESLRNHLAHSQDVVNHHWHLIARISQRFQEALAEFQGAPLRAP